LRAKMGPVNNMPVHPVMSSRDIQGNCSRLAVKIPDEKRLIAYNNLNQKI